MCCVDLISLVVQLVRNVQVEEEYREDWSVLYLIVNSSDNNFAAFFESSCDYAKQDLFGCFRCFEFLCFMIAMQILVKLVVPALASLAYVCGLDAKSFGDMEILHWGPWAAPIDSFMRLMTVWRITGKIIRTAIIVIYAQL